MQQLPERAYYFMAAVRLKVRDINRVRERKGCKRGRTASEVFDWLRYEAAPDWGGELAGCRIYAIGDDGECSAAPVFIMGETSENKETETSSHGVKPPPTTEKKITGPWDYGKYVTGPLIVNSFPLP